MSQMPFEDMERVYERLAENLEAAGPTRDMLFLTRLALLLADAVGDGARVEGLIEAALNGLPQPAEPVQRAPA